LFLTLVKLFIPVIVEIKHLGGIDLTNYKCLDAGLEILDREGMSTSTHYPPSKGLEAIKFIFRRFIIDTNIFRSGSLSSIVVGEAAPDKLFSSNSYHCSMKASGVITPTGTCVNLNPWSRPPIFSASSTHF
jgi:hypothetical protein